MEIIQNRINSETVNIYTIFDTHFGAANQREKEFRELVKIIEKDKNGYWIGGGDYCMPLDTEILTNRGFITQDKLTVNDSILSLAPTLKASSSKRRWKRKDFFTRDNTYRFVSKWNYT